MLIISNIYRNNLVTKSLILPVRFKTKIHWAKLRKKTGPKDKALNHFDEFYSSVFGNKWEPMREALLRRSKYVALVNNYGDAEETVDYLTNRGAHCLKKLTKIQQEFQKQYSPLNIPESHMTIEEEGVKIKEFMSEHHTREISNIYPHSDNKPERLDMHGEEDKKKVVKNNEKLNHPSTTLDQSMAEAQIDMSRIIDPSLGITNEALYQFIPATKLKGMEDWVPESYHYSYYSKEQSFPLTIEQETELNYPEHLKVFTYEMDSEVKRFPEPKRSQTGVFNYYPMDCGSVLTVLTLNLSAGDRVLDLCSAPGGKALVALQTLLPDVIVCNDISISRSNRTQRTFSDYLFDFDTSDKWRERVVFQRIDGRHFVDHQGFDKVLVDVPCTTDRHSINEDDNNIFRADRIKERLKIPEMQSQLLINALKLVKVGGSVVYSTCSLSPIQNDGVVHMSLKQAFEMHSILAVIKDMTPAMSGFSSTLTLGTGSAAPKYGQLVTPSVGANFGPSYISKLVRIR